MREPGERSFPMDDGAGPGEAAELERLAGRLRDALDAPPPGARRARALFVSGVGARGPRLRAWRAFVPALAVLALAGVVLFAGRGALPGEALYPVRQALDKVGLAQGISAEINRRLAAASRLLDAVTSELDRSDPRAARVDAARAMFALGRAQGLAKHLGQAERALKLDRIARLRTSALAVIARAHDQDASGSQGTDRGPGGDRGASGAHDRSAAGGGGRGSEEDKGGGPGPSGGEDHPGTSGPSEDHGGLEGSGGAGGSGGSGEHDGRVGSTGSGGPGDDDSGETGVEGSNGGGSGDGSSRSSSSGGERRS